MLAMPRFFHSLLAFLGHKIGHHESLRGGQVNDGERARVFQSVQERAATVVRRARVFDYTLPKAHDVWKTKSDIESARSSYPRKALLRTSSMWAGSIYTNHTARGG